MSKFLDRFKMHICCKNVDTMGFYEHYIKCPTSYVDAVSAIQSILDEKEINRMEITLYPTEVDNSLLSLYVDDDKRLFIDINTVDASQHWNFIKRFHLLDEFFFQAEKWSQVRGLIALLYMGLIEEFVSFFQRERPEE